MQLLEAPQCGLPSLQLFLMVGQGWSINGGTWLEFLFQKLATPPQSALGHDSARSHLAPFSMVHAEQEKLGILSSLLAAFP